MKTHRKEVGACLLDEVASFSFCQKICRSDVFFSVHLQEPHDLAGAMDLYLNPGPPWLTPVILASQEAEIRRIKFEASPGK
jgi:hypothetical protein